MMHTLTLLSISFLGGLVASISPCSLSMLPIIIGYIGGYSKESPLKTLIQMLLFVFGSAIVFSIIGIICAVTGKIFISTTGTYFTLIIASILMIMGLKLTNILDFEIPILIKSIPQNTNNHLYLYPFFLGMVFALAGTPCSTPVLASIMAFAGLSSNIILGISMLFLFSLAQGLIFIIAGVFTASIKSFPALSNFSTILLKISGILLILSSIYIFYKIFSPLL